MRTILGIGIAALALMGHPPEAEARGGRSLRLARPSATLHPGVATSRARLEGEPAPAAQAVPLALRGSSAPAGGSSVPAGGSDKPAGGSDKPAGALDERGPRPAAVPVAAVADAAPWCPADRIVGSGAGFCLVN
ncbi:hypothetical protein [Methylobacterium nigriterrae]|uniref:hypothetical protein n=1 Tax=Methylobacterium nigriterrae TaxID=3127512 RepID=UPI003013E1C7